MPDLIETTTHLVRAMAPDYELRWTDSMIAQAVYLADMVTCEAADAEWATHDIVLQDGINTYDLPEDAISVHSVRYAYDGTDFDEILTPVMVDHLDEFSITWQEDCGSPTHYWLLSAPGVEDYSKIVFWRTVSTVGSETVRVNYLKVRDGLTDSTAVDAPQEVIQRVYVPYVLSLLRAGEEPDEAEVMMQEFRREMHRVRGLYRHPASEVSP